MARNAFLSLILTSCCFVVSATSLQAAIPADQILPTTTKGYISVPDADELQRQFNETQLGQLIADPVMQPFVDDLKEQLKHKLTEAGVRVGIKLDDLKGLRTGELCFATIQPPSAKKDQHAMAVIVDVAGQLAPTQALVQKIVNDKIQAGGKKSEQTVAGIVVTSVVTARKGHPGEFDTAVFFIHHEQLVAADHLAAALDLAGRMASAGKDSLKNFKPFDETMNRVHKAAGDVAPHVKWFVEPIGYAEVSKAAIPAHEKKRGRDLLKILTKQGFDCVKGLGGYITFNVNHHEVEHRTFVYAPPVTGVPANEKYRLAARMLNFPNNDRLAPLDWVPRDLSVHLSFNAKIRESFDYVGSLVDELAGAPGVWADTLSGLALDALGPQIDLKRELVAYAGERVTLLSDYRLPITPKSERVAVAIEVINEAAVAKAISKIMKADPNAHEHKIGGQVVWEIINEDDRNEEVDFQIEGAGFTSTNPVKENKKEEEKKAIPNSAVTVVHGHLLVATHLDFIKELLNKREPHDRLGEAVDFKMVDAELTKLGAKEESFRFFTRTDESYRPTYELLKQGKMPQSETMFGKLLNKIFDAGNGKVREQEIDGSKMPDYQVVRRYLGPGGVYAHSEADGWTISGLLLTKDEPKQEKTDAAKEEAKVETDNVEAKDDAK